MAYTWLTSASGFDTARASEANYPDGHVHFAQGAPAVLYAPAKYNFGLDTVAQTCRDTYQLGALSDSTVYARTEAAGGTSVVDKANRSSRNLHVTREQVAGALTVLEMQAMPFFEQAHCNAFRLSDREYTVLNRQFLAYGAGDHFAGQSGVRGHADDSLVGDGKWVRNDSPRHIVGIIWPNAADPDAAEGDLHRFSGGEIVFPFITGDGVTPLTLSPKANDTIVFPANPMYLHYVKKVKSGLRISLTTWWTFTGYRPAPSTATA